MIRICAFVVLGLGLLSIPVGASCHVVQVRSHQVHYGYGHVNYVNAAPVYSATFVALPVAIPSYGVQYQDGAAQVQLEILKLQLEVAKLQRGPQPQTQAVTQEPKKLVQPNLPADLGATLGKCVACHSDSTAKSKGNGFILVEGEKTRQLSPDEALKVLRQVRSGAMPPGQPLPQVERDVIADWVAGVSR